MQKPIETSSRAAAAGSATSTSSVAAAASDGHVAIELIPVREETVVEQIVHGAIGEAKFGSEEEAARTLTALNEYLTEQARGLAQVEQGTEALQQITQQQEQVARAQQMVAPPSAQAAKPAAEHSEAPAAAERSQARRNFPGRTPGYAGQIDFMDKPTFATSSGLSSVTLKSMATSPLIQTVAAPIAAHTTNGLPFKVSKKSFGNDGLVNEVDRATIMGSVLGADPKNARTLSVYRVLANGLSALWSSHITYPGLEVESCFEDEQACNKWWGSFLAHSAVKIEGGMNFAVQTLTMMLLRVPFSAVDKHLYYLAAGLIADRDPATSPLGDDLRKWKERFGDDPMVYRPMGVLTLVLYYFTTYGVKHLAENTANFAEDMTAASGKVVQTLAALAPGSARSREFIAKQALEASYLLLRNTLQIASIAAAWQIPAARQGFMDLIDWYVGDLMRIPSLTFAGQHTAAAEALMGSGGAWGKYFLMGATLHSLEGVTLGINTALNSTAHRFNHWLAGKKAVVQDIETGHAQQPARQKAPRTPQKPTAYDNLEPGASIPSPSGKGLSSVAEAPSAPTSPVPEGKASAASQPQPVVEDHVAIDINLPGQIPDASPRPRAHRGSVVQGVVSNLASFWSQHGPIKNWEIEPGGSPTPSSATQDKGPTG